MLSRTLKKHKIKFEYLSRKKIYRMYICKKKKEKCEKFTDWKDLNYLILKSRFKKFANDFYLGFKYI